MFSFKILIWLSNTFRQANKNGILQVETSIFAMSLKKTPSSLPPELNASCCEPHLVLPLSQTSVILMEVLRTDCVAGCKDFFLYESLAN